ncbi:AAA family ATPase [Streptomyces sp. NPDC005483]|uniref:AAA family ATPase n=1 Tax=Streptomyces sp. NPDC005483 TaxID=3154882 RepID=UPI0033A5C243
MLSRAACAEVLAAVAPEAFYKPPHVTIFNAITHMFLQGHRIDQITVAKYLADAGDLERVGGASYLYVLVRAVPTAANGDYYATIVQDRALRRGLIELGARVVQMGYATEGETSELVERTVVLSRELRDRGMAADELPTLDLHDFLAVKHAYDWLVPGLLERGDRLILTAAEGGGKSTLMRQIAICSAAGLDPFTQKPIDPLRVLILDCENGEAATRRALAPLAQTATRWNHRIASGQLSIECQPAGVDLTKAQDRAWLMRRVEKLKPEMLIIGPVYRLHAGNPNDEELARKVTVVIDEARATAGCAVLMEAHAPHHNGFSKHRDLRPAGSSLWKRWPEFGYGLRPVDDELSAEQDRARAVVPWRGARDERDWPTYLKQGSDWPWTPYKPPYNGSEAVA